MDPMDLPQPVTPLDEPAPTPEPLTEGFYYVDKAGQDVELDELDQEWLVGNIKKRFDEYDKAKKAHKDRWKATEKAVRGVASSIEADRFNGLVPYGKQCVQTLVSQFWGRSLATPAVLFNVRGQDEESKGNAPTMKEALGKKLKQDRLAQKLDNAIYLDALMKGVCIAYVGYEIRKEYSTAPKEHMETAKKGKKVLSEDNGAGQAEFEHIAYEGATVKIVDPKDFVFDTNSYDNWDACFKAYRSWAQYEDIADNPNYQNFEELYEKAVKIKSDGPVNPAKVLSTSQDKQHTEVGIDGHGKIELIEFHGDIRIKDKTYLRNWKIVIAGREKVICFEKNPSYINPFCMWRYEETQDGWGISPIDYIIPLINAGSTLLNVGVEAGKLALNPPMLAPSGMLPQKRLYLKEGMVIEYTPNVTTPNAMPVPMQFNTQAPFPYLQMLESQTESTTMATRQLSGDTTSTSNQQTATEFQGLQTTANAGIDRIVELFNLDFKIPIIEKFAKITSFFNPEPMQINTKNDEGAEEFKEMDSSVWFGNYEFVIEDNKSEIERKANVQQMIALLAQGMQDPDINQRLKKIDTFKAVIEDMGYGSPNKFFFNDEEFASNKLTEIALANFIAQVSMQMPLGQMVLANGGRIDPMMISQMSMQAAAQAQGVVGNATGHPPGGSPEAQSPGIPNPHPGLPDTGTVGGVQGANPPAGLPLA